MCELRELSQAREAHPALRVHDVAAEVHILRKWMRSGGVGGRGGETGGQGEGGVGGEGGSGGTGWGGQGGGQGGGTGGETEDKGGVEEEGEEREHVGNVETQRKRVQIQTSRSGSSCHYGRQPGSFTSKSHVMVSLATHYGGNWKHSELPPQPLKPQKTSRRCQLIGYPGL